MRPRELQCVVTYHTTTEAMDFEEAARQKGLGGRIIPLPRSISAGCGLAWRDNPKDRALIESLLQENNLGFDGIYEIIM